MKQRLSAFVILILALAMGTVSPRTQSRVDVPQRTHQSRRRRRDGERHRRRRQRRFTPEGDLPDAGTASARSARNQRRPSTT